ncbi:unnamed protein product (macronuclear) [Paramecium tetraurelia]|uniref:PH domain-containing protein n=1 Tax=Paramecium tetraurelia TaxID=5888 RepID=A0ECR4_PARTE|nr:uncharacterized protein GSPATT00003950001 [Paramecium tetraurelia]CAK93081.1 unnamed protein product [Paramecium tetraurelia]|eukprot:XP_001460478.1 hypothetical protein (macronuclear) [Paramecium tetraurelia strain d4-2]
MKQQWNDINEDVNMITILKSKFKQTSPTQIYYQSYDQEGLLLKDKIVYKGILRNYTFVLQRKEKNEFILDFNQYPIQLSILSNDVFQLSVLSYQFQFQSLTNSKQWILSLNYYINTSKPYCFQTPLPNFFLQHTIPFDIFEKRAESLDLLLFKNKSIACQLQRLITNSEYDHVALLLRNNKNLLHVFEANSDDGVCIYTWDALMQSNFKDYVTQISFRQLYTKRDMTLLLKLQDFVYKNHGKKYSANIMKLCKKRSITGVEKENYFCSELIAACYKHIGIMENDISSCQFWPKDFAGNIKLTNAQLSHEIIIFQ